ncbi:MAG: type I 3-dehydroquinate dehydratase, partial [Lentisphaeria bacterium]|nr:type I 3-dehydroquinate dehydratase [Lentisphaeria bacterium]
MKKSFLNRQNTAVTALFTGKTVAELLAKTRNAAANGADGIAVEIHNLPPELRTVDTFKTLVDEVPLPFMFICYRSCQWYGSDDEARQEFLLRAAEAGAEVIDVMGDLYCKSEDELTTDPAAIEKQKKLIEEIHARGAK